MMLTRTLKLKTLERYGGAEGDRTLDLRLAKPALSQLSYGPTSQGMAPNLIGLEEMSGWWAWIDSNYRPRAYQARALTT